MKKTEIMKKMSTTFSKVGFQMKKHSPEILIVAGVIGTVTSAVMACKATTKVGEIVEKTKGDVDEIHKAVKTGVTNAGETYNEDDSKKDLAIVYAHIGFEFIKLYAPSIIMGALSLTSIIASNNILRKRNAALAAAYATVDKGFKDYRGRVIERFGEGVDRELKNGVKAKKVDAIETDPETGKEKKVKKQKLVANPSDISGYARFFEQYTTDEDGTTILNRNWESNNDYNLMFLKAQEKFANDLLIAKKRVFLNEVYEALGFPRTKAGQIVGWVYDEENPIGDNYIDFGLHEDNPVYSDTENNSAILLDFNVDGNIWDLM